MAMVSDNLAVAGIFLAVASINLAVACLNMAFAPINLALEQNLHSSHAENRVALAATRLGY